MTQHTRDTYFVAVKVFLEKDNAFLVIKDEFGDWDIPGGRIRDAEFETKLEDVLARKIKEELGEDITYELSKDPIVYMRHERHEANLNKQVRIFALGYRAKYVSGDIKLSSHHTKMMWADIQSFKPEEYFTGGWLNGVSEYLTKIRS